MEDLISRAVKTASPAQLSRMMKADDVPSGSPSSGGAEAEPLPCRREPDTSLEHPQTSSEDGGELAPELDNPDSWPFVHRGWEPVRHRVWRAMVRAGCPHNRILKFNQCHDTVWLWQNGSTGEIRERGNHCNDRFCQVCGQSRSFRIARALAERVKNSSPLFITLTVRGKFGASLAGQLETLQDGWRRLREMPVWKAVRGGAVMIEVKWSGGDGGHWHPHMHIIADGRFMPQAELSRAWSVCTNGSTSVDVRRVKDCGSAVRYVAKYASKPMDGSFTCREHRIVEAITALKGVRLCACFGTWFGTALNEESNYEEELELSGWICLGKASVIEAAARDGCEASRVVLAALERQRRVAVLAERGGGP